MVLSSDSFDDEGELWGLEKVRVEAVSDVDMLDCCHLGHYGGC